jgi:hypothetical protein
LCFLLVAGSKQPGTLHFSIGMLGLDIIPN